MQPAEAVAPAKLLPTATRALRECAHLSDCPAGEDVLEIAGEAEMHSRRLPPPCRAPGSSDLRRGESSAYFNAASSNPSPFRNPAFCCRSMAVQQRLKALGRKLDRLAAAESTPSTDFWMDDFAGTWQALVQLNDPPENGPGVHRQRLEVLR